MRRLASILIGLLLLTAPALAQSTVEQFQPVPIFPLPDPATTTSHVWVTQGCATPAACDYKISPTQLGYIYQGSSPPTNPFPNQLWWNTSTNPATLEVYQNAAWGAIQSRIRLSAPLNLYVSVSGSDTNNNCTNNAAPCATIQQAVDIAETNYDLASQFITINLANTGGTPFTAGALIVGPMVGATSTASLGATMPQIVIKGNLGSPSSVVIADTSSTNGAGVFTVLSNAAVLVEGVDITSTNNNAIYAASNGFATFGNVVFGACGEAHIKAQSGGQIQATGNYTINGGAAEHIETSSGGLVVENLTTTVTVSGTPAFANAFVYAFAASSVIFNNAAVTFAGLATGPRFVDTQNSVISIGSGGTASYFPGSSAGTITTGAIYDPAIGITSITGPTGVGTGGTVIVDPTLLGGEVTGSIKINSGTSGTSSSGAFTINFTTREYRVCTATPSAGFAVGSTVSLTGGDSFSSVQFTWVNGGSGNLTNLTTNAAYFIGYSCLGAHA